MPKRQSKQSKRGRKRVLENPETWEPILDFIRRTGIEKNSWKCICSEDTFYREKKRNSEFSESIARAHEDFRKMMWRERPELILLAIDGLIAHLKGKEEVWASEYIDIKGNVSKEKKLHTRLPSRWAIEAMLGINKNNESEKSDLRESFEGFIRDTKLNSIENDKLLNEDE